MSNQGFFNDPNLKVLRINDFTPGIVRFSRGSYPVVYPSVAPVGSAASAFRCYARPGIGLVPFPTYKQIQTFSQAGPGGANWALILNGMLPLASPFGDSMVSSFAGFSGVIGVGTPTVDTWITRGLLSNLGGTPPIVTPTVVYSSSNTNAGKLTNIPNLDYGEFQNGSGVYSRAVVTTDFVFSNPNLLPYWVTVPDWNSTADSNSGSLSATGAFETPRIFYHATRAGIFQCPFNTTPDGFAGNNGDLLQVSTTPLSMAAFSAAGTFFPEMGAVVGTWGSINTGELFILYTQGGACLIYGDLLFPTNVIKLPGVVGTGNVIGKAAVSSVGLVYATEADGVYAWNGGNQSEKISAQVPDDVFFRSLPTSIGFQNDHTHASQATWGQWIMFPNNWVYDQLTRSWWNSEDPGTLNFQVHSPSVQGQFFHSAPGFVTNNSGASLTLGTYRFDKFQPASTYTWVSNPIPSSLGALVDIQNVEIVASNPTATSATITVTPTVPAGQTAFPNQNPSQGVTFTIPPTTVASRQSLRLGYTDSNIQIQVVSTNSNGANAAPTLHELNIGWVLSRTSGVA